MAYTTITARRDELDEAVQAFADDAGTSSIDAIHGLAGHGHNQVTALVEYTAV